MSYWNSIGIWLGWNLGMLSANFMSSLKKGKNYNQNSTRLKVSVEIEKYFDDKTLRLSFINESDSIKDELASKKKTQNHLKLVLF